MVERTLGHVRVHATVPVLATAGGGILVAAYRISGLEIP